PSRTGFFSLGSGVSGEMKRLETSVGGVFPLWAPSFGGPAQQDECLQRADSKDLAWSWGQTAPAGHEYGIAGRSSCDPRLPEERVPLRGGEMTRLEIKERGWALLLVVGGALLLAVQLGWLSGL